MDWDSRYQQNDTPWDKNEASPPLIQFFSSLPLPASVERVLVPGCGIGHDAAWLANNGYQVTALDLSPTAIQRAQQCYPMLNMDFICDDLFNLPATHKSSFNRVVEHTCFCALRPEDRHLYVESIAQLLKPSGKLTGIWFLNPEMQPDEQGPPFGISLEELIAIFSPFFSPALPAQIPTTGFEGSIGRECLLEFVKHDES
jgi:SAM-dependent methyltransferase